MTILQQYYTSFVNQEAGRAGFQIKAMSPEISPETQSIISRLLAYHIPAGVDERAIETHPVALRYYYHNEREGILLCSQSCGSDENGRPGNFFAHSLVISPKTFSYQPPILYWHSPFWQHDARGTNKLVPLSERDMRPSATLMEQMWAFLAEKGRTEAFYSLMCAVVHSKRTGQRIIILDSDEHVALWETEVSCMLPPQYRPFHTFSTYYHDPYQSWFLITGTSDPFALHASLEASTSHFILDGRTNQTSSVQPSDYAGLIRPLCNRDKYHKILLQYFVDSERRFPKPTDVDDSLEMLATYIQIRTQKEPVKLQTSWLPTINAVLDSFDSLPDYEDEEDEKELEQWIEMLDVAREESAAPEVLILSQWSKNLYKKYKVPPGNMLMRDLIYYTKLLLQQEPMASTGAASLRELRSSYGESAFIDLVNQRTYVERLVDVTQDASGQQFRRVWMHLGPYLLPAAQYRNLFARSIYVWGQLREQDAYTADQLLAAIKAAIVPREANWFDVLRDIGSRLPAAMLADFYWQCVKQKPLDEREVYRAPIEQVVRGIVDSEFHADLAHANTQDKIAVLNRWMAYTRETGVKAPDSVVGEGLRYLQKQHKAQWPTFCAQVLLSDEMSPYLEKWEATLVKDWLETIGLHDFSEEYAPLYTRYENDKTLSEAQKCILTGLMVLVKKGQFDADSILSVHSYLDKLSAESYFTEASGFISVFLQLNISLEQHADMIRAFFLNKYALRFWLAYWQTITAMLTRLSTPDMEGVVRLFSFWFSHHPTQFEQQDQAHIVHQFFLTLPQHLHSLLALSDASSAFDNLSSKANAHPWYPIVQDLLTAEKKNLVSKRQELLRFMQQRLPIQKKQSDDGELNRAVERLLQKGHVYERHVKDMQPLYNSSGHQPFWDAYKERLLRILCSNDAEHVLEIFSFWFEESFKSFGQKPYLAQGFLSKIASIFEAAWKEQEGPMKKSAQQLTTAYKHTLPQKELCKWYPLLQPFILNKKI